MNDSAETKIVEFHLRRYTQSEITAALHTSKTHVSRSIRHFHETGLIPDAFCVGRPGKVASEFMSYIEAKTIEELSMCGESLSGEISDDFEVSLSRIAVKMNSCCMTPSPGGRNRNVS
jgi:transposase